MSRRFFDYDPVFDMTDYYHYDHSSDKYTIETVQDVQPIIDFNKRQWNDGDGYTPSREMKKIATIPLNIVQLWKEKYGIDIYNKNHAAGIKRLLNDPDWRYLRTSSGIT